jgi:hypothetical protein
VEAMRMACLEKYAWGRISPNIVIAKVEKRNAATPAKMESESSVRSTFTATLPQRMVVRVKFGSTRKARTCDASERCLDLEPQAAYAEHGKIQSGEHSCLAET